MKSLSALKTYDTSKMETRFSVFHSLRSELAHFSRIAMLLHWLLVRRKYTHGRFNKLCKYQPPSIDFWHCSPGDQESAAS
jgi:hypothetical protein